MGWEDEHRMLLVGRWSGARRGVDPVWELAAVTAEVEWSARADEWGGWWADLEVLVLFVSEAAARRELGGRTMKPSTADWIAFIVVS